MWTASFHFTRAGATTHPAYALVPLVFPDTLRSFLPRLTAGNLAPRAEVRVWDPLAAKVISTGVATATTSVAVPDGDPATVAGTFRTIGPPTPPASPGALGDLGPAPDEHATVVAAPLALGAAITPAATEAARGLAERHGSTFAEADGEATGDPLLRAGAVAQVSGVAAVFCGSWVITRAQHVFDHTGYRTGFEVSGRHDRSLLGLATGGTGGAPTRMPGLVCGIVSNINDPLTKGRVKVTLPWLSPQYESDWALVAQAGAGARSGAVLPPEVGDEVLVGLRVRRPAPPVRARRAGQRRTARTPSAARRSRRPGRPRRRCGVGSRRRSGNRLAFHDELPPGTGPQPPTASDLVLGTANGNLSLAIDQVAGTVTLRCDPAPPESKSAVGTLTIECGKAGTIDIKTGAGGTVNIDGGARPEPDRRRQRCRSRARASSRSRATRSSSTRRPPCSSTSSAQAGVSRWRWTRAAASRSPAAPARSSRRCG